MELAITVGLAIVGGICTLAFVDMPAFKRLMRFAKPVMRFVSYVGLGLLIGGFAVRDGNATATQVSHAGTIAVLGSAAFMLLLGFLLWLREGLTGFNDI